jgi:hypothetical protein
VEEHSTRDWLIKSSNPAIGTRERETWRKNNGPVIGFIFILYVPPILLINQLLFVSNLFLILSCSAPFCVGESVDFKKQVICHCSKAMHDGEGR